MEGNIFTNVNRGRGGTYYLAVRISTHDELTLNKFNELMKSLGYRAFPAKSKNPAWTKQVIPTNISEIESEINRVTSDLSVTSDLKGLEIVKNDFASLNQQQTEQGSQSESTDTIESFIDKLKKEMQTTSTDEQSKMMGEMIAQQLETLAQSVDETKKQSFVKDFFEFASKFWQYSFSNQMLIFFQSEGKAIYVKGKKQWQEMGRRVKEDANPIAILAPATANSKVDSKGLDMVLGYVNYYINTFPSELDLKLPNNIRKFLGFAKTRIPGQRYFYLLNLFNSKRFKNALEVKSYLQDKAKNVSGDSSSGFRKFKAVLVYDYNHTDPIEGYKGKVFSPISKDMWMSKYNTEDDKSSAIASAAIKLAKEKGINIDLEKDTGSAGGWSEGKNIAISYDSKGQRQLSTVIHEIAHSLLHFGKEREVTNHLGREIDAESTSYIVMKHFGFEADHAPNYLALSGASSKEIKERRESITKAVKEILTGIHKYLMGDEKKARSNNWYKIAKNTNYTFEDWFIPVIYIDFLSDN